MLSLWANVLSWFKNILFRYIKYIEKDWVRRKVRHYPIKDCTYLLALRYRGVLGDEFALHARYNEVADVINIVVLYPQAIRSLAVPTTPTAAGTGGDTPSGNMVRWRERFGGGARERESVKRCV